MILGERLFILPNTYIEREGEKDSGSVRIKLKRYLVIEFHLIFNHIEFHLIEFHLIKYLI